MPPSPRALQTQRPEDTRSNNPLLSVSLSLSLFPCLSLYTLQNLSFFLLPLTSSSPPPPISIYPHCSLLQRSHPLCPLLLRFCPVSPRMGSRGKRRSYRCCVQPLTPLMEGPDVDLQGGGGKKESSWDVIRAWVRMHMDRGVSSQPVVPFYYGNTASSKRVDLRLTLGVLGCPLAPICLPAEPAQHHCLALKDNPLETSSASYIIQQYLAATGCLKREKGVKNVYTAGSLRMACCEVETGAGKQLMARGRGSGGEGGCFVLWQMSPGMWSVELVVAGCKVTAGSDGKIVWRHMPWLGTHAAKGPLRPLRRIIQGLDPKSTAGMFGRAQCVGEKRVGGDDCFVLKASADQEAVAGRSEGPAEVIRHVLHGYFSQRSGLLVYLEDSHLARVQTTGAADTVYWETTIATTLADYRPVDGLLLAHQGRSVATIFRFGDGDSDAAHTRTRMEEAWRIDDVVFDVPGLSMDHFIPPADLLTTPTTTTLHTHHHHKAS